jgi:hypothetical protein
MARIRNNGNGARKKQPPRRADAEARVPPEPAGEGNRTEETPPQEKASGERASAQTPPIFKSLADTTSHVVRQAASILEEEIAAGILAARQIEDKFIDTVEIRSGKPDEAFHRFRRDAHEVVDIVMDVVGATVRNAGRMAQRAISIRNTSRSAADSGSISVLTMPQPVKPGETGEVSLVVENDGETTAEPFELHPTDLISAGGHRISSHAIELEPAQIKLEAHQNQRVVVRVKPGPGTPAGTYSGLIQSSRSDQLRAVLTVVIA